MRKDESIENRGPNARANENALENRSDLAKKAGIVAADDETAERVLHDTTTRERQSRSKRAHEPVDMVEAAEEQPVEDDNGPRLPEVNAAISAKVEDPAQPTQTDTGPTNETAKPVVK